MRNLILIFLILLLVSCGGGNNNSSNTNPLLLKLYWEPAGSEDIVSGYKLYVGYESRKYETIIDVGNVTEKLLELDDNETYYIACTAYYINIMENNQVEESDYSDEIIYSTKKGN